jgi:hypothetical protein
MRMQEMGRKWTATPKTVNLEEEIVQVWKAMVWQNAGVYQ